MKLKNFGISICRGERADSNNKQSSLGAKLHEEKDLEISLKFQKLLFFFQVKFGKIIENKKKTWGIAFYISLPNFVTQGSVIKKFGIFLKKVSVTNIVRVRMYVALL